MTQNQQLESAVLRTFTAAESLANLIRHDHRGRGLNRSQKELLADGLADLIRIAGIVDEVRYQIEAAENASGRTKPGS